MKVFLQFLLVSILLTPSVFPQGYKLVWSDEFNDSTLDLSKWSFEIGNNHGYNNEMEYYTSRTQNCSEQNGLLTITALKESYSGFNYTSARINTQNKFSFKYGKIEARIKLPYGQGIWPAFWMLGDNINQVSWPGCGEIDIMEMIGGQGRENTVYGSAHWGGDYSK
ncbi:MAG TPA: glycoside hydrolase family 16 protein, partial [Ignavibacteriaceae bacterium]|nr:glycoside hydrolase family 16 protein [Ignavibacteriaceae bacterium]